MKFVNYLTEFIKKLFNLSFRIAFFVLCLYIVFTFLRLKKFNYIPSYFVVAGKIFCDSSLVPSNLVVDTEAGFDGQFYYRFALNPFTSERTEFGITIDAPPYRHQRIVYPFIVWLLSLGGKAELVPSVMIGVNLLFIFFIAYILTKIFSTNNFYSITLSLLPGFVLTLSRDLPEIVASFFIIFFLYLFDKKKYFLSSIVLILGILAKETTLVVPFSGVLLCFYSLFKKQYKEDLRLLIFVIPIITWFIWQVVMYRTWGTFPVYCGKNNFGLPFLGIYTYLLQTFSLGKESQLCCIYIFIFVVLFSLSVIFALKSVKSSRTTSLLKIVWFLYFCEIIIGTKNLWVEDNPLRVYSEFYISGFFILFNSNSKLKVLVSILSIILWFGMVCIWVKKL